VLDLTNPPVVIDEPGLYAIDRDWQIPRTTAEAVPELIQITADNVTLDLHGFEIESETAFAFSTLLVITGSFAEIRQGELMACCEGSIALRVDSPAALHHVTMYSFEAITLAGGSIADSELSPNVAIRFAGRASLERNTIFCNHGTRCVRLSGDRNLIRDNRMTASQGGGIELLGNASAIANNFVDLSSDVDGLTAFDIKGDHNVVRGNTVLAGFNSGGQPLFAISGTANTLDGNIVATPAADDRARNGMAFTADGNYYGNNRIAAEVPFALGGTVQTDWGGNVGY
jgi:hypothetical protein